MAGNKCPILTSSTKYAGKESCMGDDCVHYMQDEEGDFYCGMGEDAMMNAFLNALQAFIEDALP